MKLNHNFIRELTSLEVGVVHTDYDLKQLSKWRTGGRASCVVEPDSIEALQRLLGYFHRMSVPWACVGGGSNLFFDDAGVAIPLVRIGAALSAIGGSGGSVVAEAGAWVPNLALYCLHAGLGGVEHIIGIPGTVGGLAVMNGGSLRRVIGENIVFVDVVSPEGELLRLTHDQCEFSYRTSVLQRIPGITAQIGLSLPARPKALIRAEMLKIISERRRKFPLKQPNCGSVFVSDPKLYETIGPPGKVIESLGLKGMRLGGAEISPKHANFIVNNGDATSADIFNLIVRTRREIRERYGRELRCEVRFMNKEGEVREVHDWLFETPAA